MSSSNKSAKRKLMERYGAECFIEKLHLRKDSVPRTYTGKGQKKRMKQLTYHHIKMKKDGGKATVENGALLSAENHQWFHRQNQKVQGYLNAIFQEYKRQTDECRVVFVDELPVDFKINSVVFDIDEKDKEEYNRAKEKQKVRKQTEDYLDR